MSGTILKEDKKKFKEDKKEFKAAGKAYAKMMKTVNKGEITKEEFGKKAKEQFINGYKSTLEKYDKDYAPTPTSTSTQNKVKVEPKDISSDFGDLYKAYEEYKDQKNQSSQGANQQKNQSSQGANQLIKDSISTTLKDKELKEKEIFTEEEVEGDSKITNEQKEGLKDISKWLLRNMEKTGFSGHSKSSFVFAILNLPARLRLLAYYLVENNKTESDLKNAIKESQTTYVPNLEKFKDEIITTKFKSWTRITGGQFKWIKLENAMRIARAYSYILLNYGNLGKQEENVSKSGGNKSQGGKTIKANLDKTEIDELLKLEKNCHNCKEAVESDRNDQKKQQDLKKALNEYYGYAKKLLEKILLSEKIEKLEVESRWDRHKDDVEGAVDVVGSGFGIGSDTTGSSVFELLSEEDIGIIADSVGDILGYCSLGFDVGSSVISNIQGIVDFLRACKETKYSSHMERTERAFDSIQLVIDDLLFIATNTIDICNKAKVVGDMATNAVGTGAGMVTGTVEIVAGTTSLAASGRQGYHVRKAREEIDNITDKKEKGTAEQILELRKRQLKAKSTTAGMTTVKGVVDIAAAGAGLGGPIGTGIAIVLEGISFGISIAQSITEFFMKRHNINNTIDAFIDMNTIYTKIENAKKSVPEWEKSNKRHLKNQIRLEAAAQMGCYSKESFYNYITRSYAQFLHDHVFHEIDTQGTIGKEREIDNNGKVTPDEDEKYVEMMKAYGLKPKYRKSGNLSEKARPTVDEIQKRMGN